MKTKTVTITAFNDGRTFRFDRRLFDYAKKNVRYSQEILGAGGQFEVSLYNWPGFENSVKKSRGRAYGDGWLLSIHLSRIAREKFGIKPNYFSYERVKALAWHFGWGPKKDRINENPNKKKCVNLDRRASLTSPALAHYKGHYCPGYHRT